MAWFQAGRGGGVMLCYKPVSGSPASHPPFLLPAPIFPLLNCINHRNDHREIKHKSNYENIEEILYLNYFSSFDPSISVNAGRI